MNDKDRIRLAEWMDRDPGTYAPNHDIPIFDPFTDANDDYAVLEWMREQAWPAMLLSTQHADRLTYALSREIGGYKIGDYARAALKVIP